MARGLLGAILVVAAAFLVVADVVVYEEDLNRSDPGLQGHAWTIVDNGPDGSSKYVMEVQSMSLNGGEGGLQMISDLLENLGFGDGDEPGSWGAGSTEGFDWSGHGINSRPNVPDVFSSSPFLVHDSITHPSQSSFFSVSVTDDHQGIYAGSREHMLQNVACLRLRPALSAVKSQGSSFIRHEDTEEREVEESDPEFLLDDGGFRLREAHKNTSSGERRACLWNKIVFITLTIGCFLMLFVCIRQGLELKRAMKETSQTAIRVSGDSYEEKPLLSKIEPKSIEEDNDGYINVMISPIYSGPAFKAKCSSSPKF